VYTAKLPLQNDVLSVDENSEKNGKKKTNMEWRKPKPT